MKFLWTNFRALLKRFRAASLLNIAGLGLALAVFIVVAIQAKWDLTYDRGYKNAEKIFTIRRYMHADGRLIGSSQWRWPVEIAANIPEVENYTLFSIRGETVVDCATDGGQVEQHTVMHVAARGGFLEMFTPSIIHGTIDGLFADPGLALISRKTAERIFGRADVAGRTLTLHNEQTALTVGAVYEDFSDNQTIRNGLYSYIADNMAGDNFSYDVYYMIAPAAASTVAKKINDPAFMASSLGYDADAAKILELRLPALSEMYLYGPRRGEGRQINSTMSLLAVGALVLLIAWINFINLAMAMAPSRVRSINIHRILGIGRRAMRISMAFEGVGLTIIALAVALLAVRGFASTPMSELFDSPLDLMDNLWLVAGVAAAAIAVAFAIGLYAARYSTGFDVAIALKGSFALSKRGARLRNVLIVVQLTAAMVLISIAGTVKIQHDYMTRFDWGFDRQNIIHVDAGNLGRANWESFGEELKKNPVIGDWTVTASMPGRGLWSWNTREFEGRTINTLPQWNVWPNFLRFFGIAVATGSDFPDESESGDRRIIFNEEFARVYGFGPGDIGKKYFGDWGEIVGFSKNVNFETMHEPLQPMAFIEMGESIDFGHYFIKIQGSDISAALDYVENTWRKFTDVEFDYAFLDDEMAALYRRENNMAQLIGLFSLATVIIAMMGVYGLIYFNARYRTREISIRRVNGATVGEVMAMLNRAMIVQLVVAAVAATAIAWFVVVRWLDGFAYRAAVPWWLFAAAALAVAAVSMATVSLQSWRAATANPVNSLKSE